jgi:NADH dehydrogenase
MAHTKTDILILGAGIAGYEAYRTLCKKLNRSGIKKTITIVDQNNYFTFTPLLHEVASGAVLPSHASFPIREVLVRTPHQFVCATVTHIDPKQKRVTTSRGDMTYEQCIVALGSVSNLFDVPGADEHTYRVRTLEHAVSLNQALICKLEEPGRTSLSLNVVGGGYTGIEIAAEFAHLKKEELSRMYPHIAISIHVIQAGELLVPNLPAKARLKIMKRLDVLGVQTHLESPAKKVTASTLTIGNSETLPNDITIWVTGFTTNAPSYFDAAYVSHARVPVTNHLHLENHPDTYVIGDMALIRDPDNDDIIYPQLGEAAHHEGIYVANHIINTAKKRPHKHFHFRSRGQLMPVGEWYGIGVFGPIVLSGKFMWWLRRTVYVMFMPGFVRKLRIVADWTFISKSTRHLTRLSSK